MMKRWEWRVDWMTEASDGDYVLYAEVERLCDENKRLLALALKLCDDIIAEPNESLSDSKCVRYMVKYANRTKAELTQLMEKS